MGVISNNACEAPTGRMNGTAQLGTEETEARGEARPTVWNSQEQTLGQKPSRFENVNEMNGL